VAAGLPVVVTAGCAVTVRVLVLMILAMIGRRMVVTAGFTGAVFVPGLMPMIMPVRPMDTGFGLFGAVGFGVAGVRHGGFLVRFVV
jgi:hypothetical protein